MPIVGSHWEPDISEKQKFLMNLCRQRTGSAKYILTSGPRWSSKSVGCCHCVCDHAWRIKDAVINVLVPTVTSGSDSGIWTLLTEKIIPLWIGGDFGFDWITEPKSHGTTKKFFCELSNQHGGKSRIELNSLKDERTVEKDYKNRYFSMIYWPELSAFKNRKTFDTLIHSLRLFGVPEEEHVMLCDTNPGDEGTASWIYKLWYEFRISSEVTDEERPLQKALYLLEIFLEDNPYLSGERKREIRSSFAGNPDLYARYAEGRWVKALINALFADVFHPNVHVIGDADEKDPEILVPEDGCYELISSHDAGGVNPVSYVIEPCVRHEQAKDDDGKEIDKPVSVFKFLDELAFIGEEISVAEFTHLFVEKMDFWEQIIENEADWMHYADRSALDHKESIAHRTVADEMFLESDGRIKLIGVEKGRGSVASRIRLWRKLLAQNRIVISGPRCPKLVEMCQVITRGKSEGSIAMHSPYKHPFDAASYALYRICWKELQDGILTLRKLKKSKVIDLVSVKM